ncbi:MAG TPA: hypothetical protein VFI98_07030 [Pseudolabrys sp.]|jgi:hypothetical protein|nr:hypothetical protein [Pseudolabrys sp.]
MPRFALVGVDLAIIALICVSLVSSPPAFKTSDAPVACPPPPRLLPGG